MVAEVDERQRALAELARAVVARAPVVEHGRVERGLVELVLDEHPEAGGQRRVDRAQAVQVARECPAEVHLAREVPAVADPDRVRARAELHAQLQAVDVVLDRLPADRRVRVRQAAELVRQLLPGLVLEGVRVHRIDEEAARRGIRLELGRAVGLVPRDVERDPRRHPHEAQDRLAVVELLEDVARLARAREAREARAAGAEAPRGHGHAERHRALGDALDVDAAALELPAEVRVVLLEPGRPLAVLLDHERLVDPEAHAGSLGAEARVGSTRPRNHSRSRARVEGGPGAEFPREDPLKPTRSLLALAFVLAASVCPAFARVARLSIERREPVLGGRPFGLAGPYETLVGTVEFALDPSHPRNQAVVDLGLATRNAKGEVAFTADFYMLKPVDFARGNGRIYYEVPNRGGKGILRRLQYAGRSSLDPRDEADFGDGWLMRQGFTLVWMGWQWDVPEQPGLLRLRAPIATNGPLAITGLVRAAVLLDERKPTAPLGDRGHIAYPAVDPKGRDSRLYVRDHKLDAPAARPAQPLALQRCHHGGARRRVRARAALRGRLQEQGPARGRLRLHRHARPDQLLQERRERREPSRRREARLRPRHLAERPLPAPPDLPGLQRGRGGPPRLRRRDRRGGGRRARILQPPLRAGLARRLPALEHPLPDRRVPVHRPARARSRDRRDRGPARPCQRQPHGAEALPRDVRLRVLEPRRLARPHGRHGHAGRRARGHEPRLLHRLRAARAGLAAARRAGRGRQHRREPGEPERLPAGAARARARARRVGGARRARRRRAATPPSPTRR